MPITTRLTELLKIEHPIISAPMAMVADAKLATAVSKAGGFGVLGAVALTRWSALSATRF